MTLHYFFINMCNMFRMIFNDCAWLCARLRTTLCMTVIAISCCVVYAFLNMFGHLLNYFVYDLLAHFACVGFVWLWTVVRNNWMIWIGLVRLIVWLWMIWHNSFLFEDSALFVVRLNVFVVLVLHGYWMRFVNVLDDFEYNVLNHFVCLFLMMWLWCYMISNVCAMFCVWLCMSLKYVCTTVLLQ